MPHPKDPSLTHLDPSGRPRMVDVTEKEETLRTAIAEGSIRMGRKTFDAIRAGNGPKGDVVQVARLAGIQAGKRTGDLIPLCHVLPGASLMLEVEPAEKLPGFRVRAQARYRGRTGVEMEALTAVSVALLTIYDMGKAMDRGMVLREVKLLSKEGGDSGAWIRGEDQDGERVAGEKGGEAPSELPAP